MDTLFFWLLATVTVLGAIGVIFQRNPMYSVVLLIVSFCGLSGLYVLLGAPFVAAIQIIIYAGAIMVLFLFVVMLLNVPSEDTAPAARLFGAHPRRFGAVLSFALLGELIWAFSRLQGAPIASTAAEPSTTTHEIGLKLFRDYAFAFEATSVLILVAMVGAIILARKEHP